jgi:hypothetical protein
MFDEVYRIAIESSNFEELKRELKDLHVDVLAIKDGILVTAGAQLAREGRNDKVEWMRQLGASVDDIAFAYARAGNHDRVEAYRREHGASVHSIAFGYALARTHDRVEAYRREHGASVNAIAFGYALAGNHDRVEAYRREHGAHVDPIASGYALAGNHERVEAYRTEHGASVNAIASGYALAGNHEKQKKYDINYLLDNYLNERTAVVDSSGRTKEYFHGSFFAVFQKRFTQKRDAVTALKSALNGDNVDLSKHLSTLINGNLGKELRAFVKSGMANALVEKEVNTVSDFVQALQDKNSNKQQLS